MIRLRIDDVAVPLGLEATLPKQLFAYNSEEMYDIDRVRQGRELSLRIPASSAATELFHAAEECYPARRFNSEGHYAEVEFDGTMIISGVVHLMAVEYDRERLTAYLIRIREGGGSWADIAAVSDLKQTKIDYAATLNAETIVQSWEAESVVKFLPVKHDSYEPDTPHSVLAPREKILSVADYHPFISVEKLIRAIFAQSDYTLHSRWLESDEARELHLSGAYSSRQSSSAARLDAVVGFEAGREQSVTATANEIGIVFVTPTVVQNSVGNFVTTCSSEADGELYDNSRSLTFDSRGITYTPSVAMTAGFDFVVRYTTPFSILSRKRLKCFDRVCIEPSCDIKFEVANPFEDMRENVVSGVAHSLYIFDHTASHQYRYRWVVNAMPLAWQTTTEPRTSLTPPSGRSISLEVECNRGGGWTGEVEWALYQAYVDQIGTIDIEVEISMAPINLSPDKPKTFSGMYIAGGEPGWELTLHRECRLRPRLTATPAVGSSLSFEDVAQHPVKQLALLKAVAQMYNLAIYTDERARAVYIEPYDEMYAGEVVDWQPRILLDEGFTREDAAQEVGQIRRLSYKGDGGGAVTRYNTKRNTTVGVWSAKTPSHIARQEVEHNENMVFCPTLTTTGVLLRAPSAGFLSVGDRDRDNIEDNHIRVVRYRGLVELPEGESWGFPAGATAYPFAAFHYPAGKSEEDGAATMGKSAAAGGEESFTLCFEERDGIEGLNRHYRRRYNEQGLSEKITLAIRLTAEEMAELFSLGSSPNICSRYRLALGKENFTAHIDAVEQYDAECGVARIRFMREQSEE